jgi:hypothetical protein
MPPLSTGHHACARLAVRLRVHLCRQCPAGLSDLPHAAGDRALRCVWDDVEDPMMRRTVAITPRDRALLGLLARARWLSTAQIQRRFFPGKSANAVNKRMRRLMQAGLLAGVRPQRTVEQWYRLARGAAVVLAIDLVLPRRLPAQLAHLSHINDVRSWFDVQAERGALPRLTVVAEWEFKQPDSRWTVIPDALVVLDTAAGHLAMAIEVDSGTELPNLVADKLRRYGQLQPGDGRLGFAAVLIMASGWPRLRRLIQALYPQAATGKLPCILTDIDRLVQASPDTRIFVDLGALDPSQPDMLVSFTQLICVLSHSPDDRRASAV